LLSCEESQQMSLIKTICRTCTNNKLSGAQIFYLVLGLFSSRQWHDSDQDESEMSE
jgi:hypothetical protein